MKMLRTLRAHGVEIFATAAIGWAVLLVLLDLGGSLMPSNADAAPSGREESATAKQAETGCADIGGVKVCD